MIVIDVLCCVLCCVNFVVVARVNRYEAFCIAVSFVRIAAYCILFCIFVFMFVMLFNFLFVFFVFLSVVVIVFVVMDGLSGFFFVKIVSVSASRSDVNVVVVSCVGIVIGSVNIFFNFVMKLFLKFCVVVCVCSVLLF